MSQRSRLPEARVRALWRRVALQLAVAAAAGTLTALGALLLVSWAAGRSPLWARPSAAPLALWVLTTAAVALWIWRLAARARRWDQRSAAAEIERRVGLSRGSLQGAVEPGLERPGTSRSLAEFHRARLAMRLKGLRLADLGGAVARRARSYALASLLLGGVLLTAGAVVWIGARESAAEAWAAVLHPVRYLKPPRLPALRLSAEAQQVRRSRDLSVGIEAPGRDSVQLVWRPQGEVPGRRWHRVTDGRTRAVVPRVEAVTWFWATAPDGAVSDTLRVEPIDPLLLIDVRVELDYPPHTGRERERVSAPLPVLAVPEGTSASVTGVTTRSLERVALRSASGAAIPFQIIGDRGFRSSFVVQPGSWGWDIVGSGGDALEGEPDSLRFTTVPDSAPLVRIVHPGVDTVLSVTMTQPLVVNARDDYGLSRLELVSWRVSAWGERWPEAVEALLLIADEPRASPSALIDARGRGFLPGDTLRYFVQAYDNAPAPQVGRSREYVLRLPTLDEVRERTIAEAQELVESAEQLTQRAREHQESLQALRRSSEVSTPPGARPPAAGGTRGVEFRDTEAARRALEEANRLAEQAREIQESLRELRESIERAGLNDPSVLERLREIQSLYESILTPELEEQIAALRDALVELEPGRIRDAIRQLAEGSIDFRERVERSLELLRRAALEQEFRTLETQAEELGEAHEQLSQALSQAGAEADDTLAARPGRRASDLSRRAEALSRRIGEFAEELSGAGEAEAAERATEAEDAAVGAARSDEGVAGALPGSPRQAMRYSRQALSQMRQAASALRQGRQQMQAAWRQDVVEALERAQTEALELARRQRGLNEHLGSSDPNEQAAQRSEQVALRRGVERIQEQLASSARYSLLLDPSLIQAASEAGAAMDRLLGQMSEGAGRGGIRPQFGERASEALGELAYRLMQAGQAAANASSGTGLQEALQRLAELAAQQGQLNAEAGGIIPGALGDALLQELQRLAALQRAIAEELKGVSQELGPRGQVLGQLEALGKEAEELASQLERGRLHPDIIERQNRLYHRLLDAGRSLEQDEFERERRAERPVGSEILRPGQLPDELLRGPRYPHPAPAMLRRYPPAIRRLILEYFDRLNGQERTDGS
jgi:hypothetical protein